MVETRSVAAAVLIHAAAIVGALDARHAALPATPRLPRDTITLYTEPSGLPDAVLSRRDDGGPGPLIPDAPLAPSETIDPILPGEITWATPGADARTFIGSIIGTGRTGLRTSAGAPGGPLSIRPLGAAEVERVAEPVDFPPPAYPGALRAAGIAGDVMTRYVVDTAGRVERESVVIVRSAHPALAKAVQRALGRAVFRPAEVGGRPVRQLVEQGFRFIAVR
jgi:TonB family protein